MTDGPSKPAFGLSQDQKDKLQALLEKEGLADASRGPSGPRRRDLPAGTPLPLSPSQERLWFLDRLEPDRAVYNVPAPLQLAGPLDVAALRGALDDLAARHELLRTTFPRHGDRPVQAVAEGASIELPVVDAEGLSRDELLAAVNADYRRPFDLAAGPLVRARLWRLGADEHVFLLALHHAISDAASIGILLDDLAALYAARLDGGPADGSRADAGAALQFADYALWQREQLETPAAQEDLAWWKERLAGERGTIELPADRPRPSVPTRAGAWRSRRLAPGVLAGVEAQARAHDTTPFVVFLAAFETLLLRYTGVDDVLVGTPVGMRDRVELERMPGFFVNTLVLRTDLSGAPAFDALVARVRDTTVDSIARRQIPFERVVDAVQPDRDLAQTPLFQVMFDHRRDLPRGLALRGIESSRYLGEDEVHSATAKVDLALYTEARDGEAVASVEYSTELFDAATMEALLARYERLLVAALAAPETSILDLPLCTAEDERRLAGWSGTRPVYPQSPVPTLFAAVASHRADAPAVSQGDTCWSYRELDERSNRIARALQARGVGPEVKVALYADRSPETIAAILGILKAGGAYVPLDPGYPAERIAFMLADTAAPVLLGHASLLDELDAPAAEVIRLDADWQALMEASAEPVRAEVGPDSLAYVMYTSGSTGRPKGVEIPHRAIVRLVFGQEFARFGPEVTTLQLAPLAFDASTLELWGALLHGGRVAVYPERLPTAETLGRVLESERVTTLWLTAALFNAIVDEAPRILAGLDECLTGGEALSVPHVRKAYAALPPSVQLINGYGPTESTTFAACYRIPRDVPADAASIPIGHPIANTTIRLFDERLRPVPPGVPGELCIGGDGLARGYLNRPELTAERFVHVPDPHDAGGTRERYYRTGDVARHLPDGRLEYLGRNDDQVKIRGFRIEPGEIETVLHEHPGVERAVVLARESPNAGRRLAAWVVANSGAERTELEGWLRERLPDYMVPAAFTFVDAIPVTPNGKLDRDALPEPDFGAGTDAAPVAPADELERVLAAQWADVLGLEQVGTRDDFFALGGHSLLATALLARIQKLFGVELPLRVFFQAPTVAALARAIRAERTSAPEAVAAPIERATPADDGSTALSWNQRGLWFLQRLAPESAFYNVPVALRLRGPVHTDALERALAEIVRRHESLRTTFRVGDGEPRARVQEPAFRLKADDLRGLATTEREAELSRRCVLEAKTPFDLEAGPVFRARLFLLAESEAVLVLDAHHLVVDGWSLDVLLRELGAFYDACVTAGDPAHAALAEPAVQYADWAAWQRAWLEGERWQAELDWWKDELRDAPPRLELPTDRPRPPVQAWRGASVRHPLPPELARDVRALGTARGTTVFMTVLAATQLVLARYARQEDFVVGTPVAGRTRPEITDSIGLFLNIVPLRARLAGDPTFAALLDRVRETVLSAHAHQDLPFEALVEELAPERDLSVTPIYQVLYSLRETGRTHAGGGVTFGEPRDVPTGTSKTDLAVTVDDDGEGLELDLTFDPALFDADTMRRLGAHLENALRSAVAAPEAPLSQLSLVDEAERVRLLEDWGGREVDYPQLSVAAVFAQQVERTPDAVAVSLGGTTLTYAALERRANRLAHELVAQGVTAGTPVGLCVERTPDLVVCLLAILKAGGIYVPLDPAYPRERLAFMLADVGAPVLLAHAALLDELPATEARVVEVGGVATDEPATASLRERPDTAPSTEVGPDDLAYVMYTSGSTGRPKGVEVPHRAILRLVFGQDFAHFGADVTTLHLAPLAFDASTLELWGPLLHGGRVALYPERLPTTETLGRVLAEERVTTLWLTAALFNTLVDDDPSVLAPVRECLTGGEALSVPHVRKAYAALPATVQLINGYGPTENTTFTACHRIPHALPPDLPSIPIGRPIANTRAYVLDAGLQPAPVGAPGELWIGGDGLARGYWKRPELTAERFRDDPFRPGRRMYRTGDVVRWLPDGTLAFLGRDDDQVKIRGHRIEPGETQAVLAEHPDVEQVFVGVHEDAGAGKRLVAWFVPSTATGDLDGATLATFAGERLPDYMVPSAFVRLDAMPLNANGKVDRRALPEPVFAATPGEHVAPESEVERHLAALWERVLGIADVGLHDDFFELGGHSLLAVKLLSDIKDVFGQDLPLTSLISAPTVYDQGQLLHEGVGSERSSSLVKIQPAGTRPPIFCVCSLGGTVLNQRPLAMRLGSEQPFYGLQAVDLDAKLGRPADIEDYAAHYVEIVREVHPSGPYVVGGHSFGGVVAYEMAQQLRAAECDVRMVFILDSALPNLESRAGDRVGSVLAFLRGLPWVPGEWSRRYREDPERARRDVRQKVRFLGAKLRSKLGGSGARRADPPARPGGQPGGRQTEPSIPTADLVEMTHWPENNRRIAERHYAAVLRYAPRPYAGRITLFRSRLQSPFLGLGFRMGWERVAEQGVDVLTVPGGHLSILAPPNVDVLAEKMRSALSAGTSGK